MRRATMRALWRRLFASEEEIYRLGQRETDPRHAAEFTPITRGPVFAVAALALIGLLAAVVAPFRLLRRRG